MKLAETLKWLAESIEQLQDMFLSIVGTHQRYILEGGCNLMRNIDKVGFQVLTAASV
jgi:hypothetical protein